MRPPPYGTPLQGKRKLGRKGAGGSAGTPRRAVRKKGIAERITSIPSQIAFEIGMFPHNVPLPTPQTSAWLLGGGMHFLHFLIRVNQVQKVPDSDIGWEDMYREHEGSSWFDWTTPMTFLLISASVLNALYLFSRLKLYRLHHRPEPVSSPNAKFVSAHLDHEPLQPPSLVSRIFSGAWHAFCASWRFLLNTNPSVPSNSGGAKTSKVQQLEMWVPGKLETMLFCVYSPVHPLLWMATTSGNWMLMLVIMTGVGVQMRTLTRSYETLVKDKEIIAAEVMHEYNEGFVYPRVNPIRKDVAVMTNQAETVNVWED